MAALTTSNYAARGKLAISPASSTFMFAKLLDDGPAMEVLEADCPQAYAPCSLLPKLQAHRASGSPVSMAEFFLWHEPLDSLGWWKPVEPEAAVVVRKALERYWPQQLLTSLSNGARQFILFDAGEGLIADTGQTAIAAIRSIFGDGSLASFRASYRAKAVSTSTRSTDFILWWCCCRAPF